MVARAIPWHRDRKLLTKPGKHGVSIVDDDSSDWHTSGRRTVIGEDRVPVEESVSSDDGDRLAGQVRTGLRVGHNLEADVTSVVHGLLYEVLIRRDVERGLDALVEITLQHDQTVDGLSATRIDLDNDVAIRSACMPGGQDLCLDVAKVAISLSFAGE